MKFLSNVLATVVGLFVFFMIFFFMAMLIAAFAGGDDIVSVDRNSVIELDLEDVTLDYGGKSNYKEFNHYVVNHDGLSDIIKAIDFAKDDDRIKGISILNVHSELGAAQSKALRDALADFKTSGKFVKAYADVFMQRDYYLASVADSIYMSPVGVFELKGLSSEVMFFKDFQDKSGIRFEVVRHGKYKSAVEPFLENKMSDANRQQLTVLLKSIWQSISTEIAASRKITTERVDAIATGLLARTSEAAKSEKLIDVVAYEDVYHNAIRKALKVDKDKKYNKIKILDYAENVATSNADYGIDDKIAIVYAQGEILDGEGSETYIGDGAIRRAIEKARKDKKVKAVVLRVDSPGGSALTSDLIWRELELTKQVKPVVVSMGNLAASGGYYISCGANRIFAERNTITGSIGVFGMLPNLTGISNKIGIHTERVSTHGNDADYSAFMPLSDKFRGVAQAEVERIYNTFVSRVAAGRKLTAAQVDSIGQGRIWSGTEAVKIGLVDRIGGMGDAIAEAAKLAKIREYRTEDYPEYNKNLGDLLAGLGLPFAQSKEDLIRDEIGAENYRVFEAVKMAARRKGIQALMPFSIEIR
jgi:protease-4